MTGSCRICPSCGHANEVQAYDCVACGSSLNGTIPCALPQGVPVAAAPPPQEDPLVAWVAETEAAIADAETRCQNCQSPGSVTHFPFALANIDFKFDWSWILGSVAATAVLAPLAGAGVLAWGWRRRGLAFRMNLALCPECFCEVEDFYGRPARQSYRLHPCYATLEEEGFATFVSEAEFKNWGHIQPKYTERPTGSAIA